MMRTRTRASGLIVAVLLACGAGALESGCGSGYGHVGTTSRLVVELDTSAMSDPTTVVGAPDKRLPLTFDGTAPIPIKLTARDANGAVDAAFNGFVRISVKPGTVVGVTGPNTDGRNVRLQAGVATGIGVSVAASYGGTHIWAEDIGYTPADPNGTPPPQCSNGIDDNHNGLIDFPADPGCAFANDNDENLGSFAAGASDTLWFTTPRISDVRGATQGGAGTSFPHEQVEVDTLSKLPFDQEHSNFGVVVTRIASDGFYATDIDESRYDHVGIVTVPHALGSVFAYNFSTPPFMRICDRLRSFGGTASDFFGFTELGFPTWELEPWDPSQRPCGIPEPYVFTVNDLTRDDAGTLLSTQVLLASIASLVRVQNDPAKGVDLHITHHFGPDHPKAPNYAPDDNATNCDINHDGKVDFATDPEATCAKNCQADVECSEFSGYQSQSSFNVVLQGKDPNTGFPVTGQIQANGSTSAQFDPVALRGQSIRAFTGTLRYFSGGTQFTIEARCDDDIVVDLNGQPLPSDRACVHPRTSSDNSAASN